MVARARVYLESGEPGEAPVYLGEREIRKGQVVLLSDDLGRRAKVERIEPRGRGILSDAYATRID